MRQFRISHVATGRVVNFRLLQVEARRREAAEIATMVVVQMRQHHVFHRGRLNSDQPHRPDWTTKKSASTLRRDLLGESDIDDNGAFLSLSDPDEVVHGHGRVMRVAADEVVTPLRVAHGIADGVEFVFGQGHRLRPPSHAGRRDSTVLSSMP